MDRPYSVTHFKNEILDDFYCIPQPGVRYVYRIHTRYIRLEFFFFFFQFLAHAITFCIIGNSRLVI